ncbi:hypothetical protein [Bacillus piscicola]|uniref:hypothetical protein n=1 Tax=Bacillus piscicola TaxID=1632684 RepID=UPI001F08AC1A|nr:hypothetical protein [Bacillus piscicola]
MFNRTKTVGTVSEFMNPQPKQRKKRNTASITVPLLLAGGATTPAMAAEPAAVTVAIGDGIKEKIMHSFDPLIDLITSLSYPIAGVMIAGGALMIMIGQKDKGYSLIQNSAIGYILVQLSPLMLELLVGIGDAV